MKFSSYVLKLECIGDDKNMVLRAYGLSASGQPWVAKITGTDEKYELARTFQRGKKDYAEANSIGSRGVYLYFFLDQDGIYEVFERVTWAKSRRYFARLDGTTWTEMTQEQAICAAKELDLVSMS